MLTRPLPRWKRAMDIVGAGTLLLLSLPVLLGAAALVRASGAGPVLFRQQRAGRGGRPFVMLKLRTMVVDAEAKQAALIDQSEQDGPAFKLRDDPRITPVGRLLRRTSVDELPQLINVLRGDMSLVGPRPAAAVGGGGVSQLVVASHGRHAGAHVLLAGGRALERDVRPVGADGH